MLGGKMLTRDLTRTLDIPDEPGQQITVRKLSHYQLAMAEDARLDRVLAKAARIGSVAMPQQSAEEREQARLDAEKPENRYDRATVLRYGITAWTYAEPLTPEATEELDEASAAWAFAEIMAFSLRSDAERKASAGGSPPTSGQGEGAGLPS